MQSFTSARRQKTADEVAVWRREQNAAIAARGASDDAATQEAYNRRMLQQNMNAYVCHEQLSAYTTCLADKQVRARDEAGQRWAINRHSRVQQTVCKSSYEAYTTCMDTADNQKMVLEQAVLEPHCDVDRLALLQCMNNNYDVETRTGQPQCMHAYRHVLRCGLNHLWHRYWKALTQTSDTDEMYLHDATHNVTSPYYRAYASLVTHAVERERLAPHEPTQQPQDGR